MKKLKIEAPYFVLAGVGWISCLSRISTKTTVFTYGIDFPSLTNMISNQTTPYVLHFLADTVDDRYKGDQSNLEG